MRERSENYVSPSTNVEQTYSKNMVGGEIALILNWSNLPTRYRRS